ncbi:MAG: thermonuclease family protein [Actinomycetota bacterium]|nr:thermonuclease family protein [Actinomycetota bacterium]
MLIRIKSFSFPMTIIIMAVFINGCGLFYDYGNKEETSGIRGNSDAYIVREVIDGDTIILSNNSRVRLIGINTPERGMYFFEEARDALKVMVLEREVIMEKDISEMDKYGRLLRYVYADGMFVNLEMVRKGFANCYTYPPDVKYSEEFVEAERNARADNMGLWESSKTGNITISLNYDAEGNDNKNLSDEYVVIENNGDESIDIYGWSVKDSGTAIYKFGRYRMEPHVPVYLFTGSGEDGGGLFYWNRTGPVWNNDHDTLYLRDKEGKLVEIFNY